MSYCYLFSTFGKGVEMEEKKVPEYEEMHKVLDFALDAGRILLKNGAEIFRVEETIDYICKRYKRS